MATKRLTRTDISNQLERNGVSPSRALGQNFLCDPSMVDKIIRLSGVKSGDHVVEIGPGLGSLTLALAEAGAVVDAVELDRHVIGLLQENLDEAGLSESVTIHNKDAMKVDWSALLSAQSYKVIANLPYNIATPLVLDLLAAEPKIASWLVMVQKEAGDRLAATAGSKIYGVPSIIAGYWGDVSVRANVPPSVFLPKPRVDSVLVSIERQDGELDDESYRIFLSLVRTAFQKRRKMLRGSLKKLVDDHVFSEAGIDSTSRPEEISVSGWIDLARALSGSSS